MIQELHDMGFTGFLDRSNADWGRRGLGLEKRMEVLKVNLGEVHGVNHEVR